MMKNSIWVVLLLCTATIAAMPFTTDFETGDLRGWKGSGTAFLYQPTKGDNVIARGRNQPSNHQGLYWIGTYEKYRGLPSEKPGNIQGDAPKGRLVSAPFKIETDYMSFLVGGGKEKSTRVELQVKDRIENTYVPVLQASGQNSETMRRVVWDIKKYRGEMARIAIVDDSSKSWGHINADDFRFYNRPVAATLFLNPKITQPAIVTVNKTEVPKLVGRLFDEKRIYRILKGANLVLGKKSYTPSDQKSGTVVKQSPEAGKSVMVGTSVDLWIAKPPSLRVRIVPAVAQVRQGETATLYARTNREDTQIRWHGPNGFSGKGKTFKIDTSSLAPKEYRVELLAKAGDQSRSAEALLRVLPKPGVKVPDIVGKRIEQAEKIVEEAGLRVGQIVKRESEKESGTVLAQKPAAGTSVEEGRAVDIAVSKGPPPQISYTLEIESPKTDFKTGENVMFGVHLAPAAKGVLFRFHFSDATRPTEWRQTPRAVHIYRKAGRYEVYAEAMMPNGAVIGSKPFTVYVSEPAAETPAGEPEEDNRDLLLLVAIGGGILALIGAGVYKISVKRGSHREIEGNKIPKVKIRIKGSKMDTEVDEISDVVQKSIEISVFKDRGEQSIESDTDIIAKDWSGDEKR